MHCTPHFHMEHLLCAKHHMAFTLRNGGGNNSAFADCWISGRELRCMRHSSILSTRLCIPAPEQVPKQTHRVSLQLCHCIILRNHSQSSLPQLPRKPGVLTASGACLLEDRLLGLSVVASLGRVSRMMAAMRTHPLPSMQI